ncbi:MAG: hypothetical protein JST45_00310 [Bacteroidetes bacterium]|nr:hypothetical protein [Bacteroidota bacterium]
MSNWRHGIAWHHALALPIAAVLCWLLVGPQGPLNESFSPTQPPRDTLDYPLHGFLGNYDGHPFLCDALGKALNDGSSIVLLGSSELTTEDHPSKPMNFFNDSLGIPLIAIGHADNQSFSMYTQLLATAADLSHSKLAILVSPTWFTGKPGRRGTNLANFLEYQPSPSLYRIQARVKDEDTLALPVAAYLSDHINELGTAGPVVRWLAHDGSWQTRLLYFFNQPWDAAIIGHTRAGMQMGQATKPWAPGPGRSMEADQWATLYQAGIKEHLAECTNNSVYVNDAFYSEYVNGDTRTLETHPPGQSREARDFIRLLNYIKAMHGEPFFIIQPLNPYVYANIKDVTPTMAWIRHELDTRSLPYLDLWVDDTAKFRPGTLTDVMHLGPLGWYRVDSALYSYFK